MALTGTITLNSQSLPAAYVVVSSIILAETQAQALFKVYANQDAYVSGVLPIISYPGYISYSMSQVPLDVVETSSYASGLFPGFTRVTTADKTSVTSVISDRSAIVATAQASLTATSTSTSASTNSSSSTTSTAATSSDTASTASDTSATTESTSS